MSNNQNQVDVYILAGEADAGKSKAIKYITDEKRKYVTLKTIANVSLETARKVQSIQEAEIAVDDSITELKIRRKVDVIIIALRTDPYKDFPIAKKYIDFYAKSGYNIKFVAELFNEKQNPSVQNSLKTYCESKGYTYKEFPFEQQGPDVKSKKVKQFFGFK